MRQSRVRGQGRLCRREQARRGLCPARHAVSPARERADARHVESACAHVRQSESRSEVQRSRQEKKGQKKKRQDKVVRRAVSEGGEGGGPCGGDGDVSAPLRLTWALELSKLAESCTTCVMC
eukprot:6191416-Pleurochrysis_carterae.AAC.3